MTNYQTEKTQELLTLGWMDCGKQFLTTDSSIYKLSSASITAYVYPTHIMHIAK